MARNAERLRRRLPAGTSGSPRAGVASPGHRGPRPRRPPRRPGGGRRDRVEIAPAGTPQRARRSLLGQRAGGGPLRSPARSLDRQAHRFARRDRDRSAEGTAPQIMIAQSDPRHDQGRRSTIKILFGKATAARLREPGQGVADAQADRAQRLFAEPDQHDRDQHRQARSLIRPAAGHGARRYRHAGAAGVDAARGQSV